jgi:hypothetical protein
MLGNNANLAGKEFSEKNLKEHFKNFGMFCWQSVKCQFVELADVSRRELLTFFYFYVQKICTRCGCVVNLKATP